MLLQMGLYNQYGSVSLTVNIVLLLITGAFVNGPYALITTAVSADLGTHEGDKHIVWRLGMKNHVGLNDVQGQT